MGEPMKAGEYIDDTLIYTGVLTIIYLINIFSP